MACMQKYQNQNTCNCPDDWNFNEYCSNENYNNNEFDCDCYRENNQNYGNNPRKCQHKQQNHNRCCICNIIRCFRCW